MREDGCHHHYLQRAYGSKKHDATSLHYDLRLELNGVLRSWVITEEPSCRVGEIYIVVEVDDHNLANLLFEGLHKTGPIMAWDCGTWEPHFECGNAHDSLEVGYIKFTLRGEKLKGIWILTRVGVGRNARPIWTLHKEADLPENSTSRKFDPQGWPNSICTGRTMEQIVRDWNRPKRDLPSLF